MLRKFFASFVVFLFAIFAVPFVFVTLLYNTLSDEDFYKEDLADESYYLFIEQFPEIVDLEDFPNVTKEEFSELLEKVFKPEDLRFIVVAVVNQIKNIENTKDDVEIKIPLAQLSEKRDLMAKEFTNFLYKELPECAEDDMASSPQKLQDFKCIPKNLAKEDFQNRIAMELDRSLFAKLPGQYKLTLTLPEELINRDLIETVEDVFNLFFIIGLSWLALLLGILALIIRRPWKTIVKWEMGAILWAFAFHLVFITVFKYLGGIYGIVTHNIVANNLDIADSGNSGLYFGLRLLDFVLDRSDTAGWIPLLAFFAMILWFVFAVWGAKSSKEPGDGQKHKNLK